MARLKHYNGILLLSLAIILTAGCGSVKHTPMGYPDERPPMGYPGGSKAPKGEVYERSTRSNDMPPSPRLVHLIEFPEDLDERPEELALQANRETSLKYNVGPQQETFKGVEKALSSALKKILATGSTILHIKFQCSICRSDDNYQPMQQVQYILEDNKSTTIEFRFTPLMDPNAVLNQDYPSSKPGISLIVLRDGITYDRIDVPVKVVAEQKSKGLPSKDPAYGTRKTMENPKYPNASTAIQKIGRTAAEPSYTIRRDAGGLPDVLFELVQVKDAPMLLHVVIHNITLQQSSLAIFEPSNDPVMQARFSSNGLDFYYPTRFSNLDQVKDLSSLWAHCKVATKPFGWVVAPPMAPSPFKMCRMATMC